jgi:hypothetical protein
MPESEEWPEGRPERRSDRHPRAGSPAAAARMKQQQTWVDLQIRAAIERGEFDDLPGAGKPIEGLGEEHDPDWWLKKLIEREKVVVLPPSIQLRKDDAALDDLLDRQPTEHAAREVIEDFNARVLRARYQIPVGPPLITQPRDVEETLTQWRERRAARLAAVPPPEPAPRKRRWWRRSG